MSIKLKLEELRGHKVVPVMSHTFDLHLRFSLHGLFVTNIFLLLIKEGVCLVCLPARGTSQVTGKKCTVTGYGYMGESKYIVSHKEFI